MRAAKYRHECLITREDGLNEEFLPNEVEVYSGVCLHQEANDSVISGGIEQRSPNLYLPLNDSIFEPGDKCIITKEKGRLIEAYIDSFMDYEGEIVQGTQIFLKQAMDE